MVLYLRGEIMCVRWCVKDAKRGKISKLIVFLMVLVCFPVGGMTWLMCRPLMLAGSVEQFVGTQEILSRKI